MKVYLVKKAMLETSENGKANTRYEGIEEDYFFSNKQKADFFVKLYVDNQEEWEHKNFPYSHYETWTRKQECYQHEDKKWFSKIELHEIDVD